VAEAGEPLRGLRDPALLEQELTDWIRTQVRQAGVDGVVFGLSGGIDSATVCGLAARALGSDRCLGLIMPIGSDPHDQALALDVAGRFDVPTQRVALGTAFDAVVAALDARAASQVSGGEADGPTRDEPGNEPAPEDDDAVQFARANVKPRLRMLALYYYANLRNRLVLGTGNRDELAVGYFTKHGDGAADAFPLADLLKSEVRGLARRLGVPDAVVEREPSAGLWAGQTDEAELGITYEQLDRYLATGSSGDPSTDATIRARQESARHKTTPAPVARPGGAA
jgi:NAD+ synthase